MSYLPYIDDANLIAEVRRVIDVIFTPNEVERRDLYKNVIDHFQLYLIPLLLN